MVGGGSSSLREMPRHWPGRSVASSEMIGSGRLWPARGLHGSLTSVLGIGPPRGTGKFMGASPGGSGTTHRMEIPGRAERVDHRRHRGLALHSLLARDTAWRRDGLLYLGLHVEGFVRSALPDGAPS